MIKRDKKAKNSIKICIVGAGYVGLVTGACFANMGHKIAFIDNDKEKIKNLKKGIIPIYEPGLKELISRNVKKKRIEFSTSINRGIKEFEVIFICVGTPPKFDGKADLSSVEAVVKKIAKIATSDKIIVEKSTVPVGTGDEIKKALKLYTKNKKVKFYVVSNPESSREGTAIRDFLKPDRIIFGFEGNCKAKKTMLNIYSQIKAPKVITDIKTAELIKHASNTFLASKISFINLISRVCEKTKADVKEVARGMGLDKRIGKSFLGAGIGYGGGCFPKDVRSFIGLMKDLGLDSGPFEDIEAINESQKELFVQKIKNNLSGVSGKTIAVLGLSFKPDTDDMREAPSIAIINRLLEEKAKIKAYDPLVVERVKKIFKNKIKFTKNLYQAVRGSDALVILTEWSEFKNMDLKRIKKLLKSPIIIDGRNIFEPKQMKRLGFNYFSVGRN